MKSFAITAMALVAFSGMAMAKKWNGTISDAKCGVAHADASEKSMGCVKGCVKGGQEPVFVVDGKVLKIDAASKAKVMDHLGHKVTVDGKLAGDTVTINKIMMQAEKK